MNYYNYASLALTKQILSSISIFCCLVVVVLFILLKNIRSFILEIVVFLCISELLFCSTNYYPYTSDNSVWCLLQAIQATIFELSSLIFGLFITIITYLCLKDYNLYKRLKIYLRYLIPLISFTLPAIFSIS